MVEISINHIVSLSPETADILRNLVPGRTADRCNCGDMPAEDFETRVADICVGVLKQLAKHAHPEKVSAKAEETATQAPEEPAPAPAPEENSGTAEITDAVLRQAVKAAKDKVGGQSVKDLFGEFGIRNSSECPQERRSALLARLNKLAA